MLVSTSISARDLELEGNVVVIHERIKTSLGPEAECRECILSSGVEEKCVPFSVTWEESREESPSPNFFKF